MQNNELYKVFKFINNLSLSNMIGEKTKVRIRLFEGAKQYWYEYGGDNWYEVDRMDIRDLFPTHLYAKMSDSIRVEWWTRTKHCPFEWIEEVKVGDITLYKNARSLVD